MNIDFYNSFDEKEGQKCCNLLETFLLYKAMMVESVYHDMVILDLI